MKNIPDKSIDLILCDLPYGVTSRNTWDQIIPFEPLWTQYKRITKDNAAILLTATQPFASQLIMTNADIFRYDLIWVKNKKTGFLNAQKMPLRQHESILVFYKQLPVYNAQKTTGHNPVNAFTKRKESLNYGNTVKDPLVGVSGGGQTDRHPTSILQFPVVNNDSKDKYHPTQKPVALFEYLIRTYSNKGNVVLDNCIGSGTTAVACVKSGRKFIGIEADTVFCEVARNRTNECNTKKIVNYDEWDNTDYSEKEVD